MRKPPGAPPPPHEGGADKAGSDVGDRRAQVTSAELRQRYTRSDVTGIVFIGSPARQVAGQILSGDRYCWEIADELVDILGLSTADMLAAAITGSIVARGTALLTACKDDL